jgi:hypothetical protein
VQKVPELRKGYFGGKEPYAGWATARRHAAYRKYVSSRLLAWAPLLIVGGLSILLALLYVAPYFMNG